MQVKEKNYKFQQFILQLRRCVIIFLFIYHRIKVKRTLHFISRRVENYFHRSSRRHKLVTMVFFFALYFPTSGTIRTFLFPVFHFRMSRSFFITLSFPPSPFISTDERMPKIKSPRSVSDSPNNWSEAIGHNSTIRRCRSRRGKLGWRQGLENSSLAEPHVGELNETQEFNICFISRFLLVLFFIILSFSALYYVCCFVRMCDLY